MNIQQKRARAAYDIHASQTASTISTCTTLGTSRPKQDSYNSIADDADDILLNVNRANYNTNRSNVKVLQVSLLDGDPITDDYADRMSTNEYYQIYRNLFRDDDDITAAVLQKQSKLGTPTGVHGKEIQQKQQHQQQQPSNVFFDMSYLFCLLSPPPITLFAFASWSEQSQQHNVPEVTASLQEVAVWYNDNDNTSTVSELCLYNDFGPQSTESSVLLVSFMSADSTSTNTKWSIVVPDQDCDAAYDSLWFKLMYMDGTDESRRGHVMLEGVELLEMLDVINSKGANISRTYCIYFQSGNAKVSLLEEDVYAYFATMFAITAKHSDVPMKYRYEESCDHGQRQSRSYQLLFGTSINRNVMNSVMTSNEKHCSIAELYGDI